MKHLNNIFKAIYHLLIVFLTCFLTFSTVSAATTPAEGQTVADSAAQAMDSVEVSLLTCQPHDEVYSLYGHTALRWHDTRQQGADLAFNYGVFDFSAPHFVTRFVFGITDYELGVYSYGLFRREYEYFGSMVTEQVLNLTNEEKLRLQAALADNLKPENRVYRYNYFYNNCTSKARDIIEQCLTAQLQYAEDTAEAVSWRQMVREMTANSPWAQFGNDFLLGIAADSKTTQRQRQFLPHRLMYDFDRAQIRRGDSLLPLVKERRIAVPAGVQLIQDGFPLSPSQCAWLLTAIATVLTALQWRRKKTFLAWDLLLMAAIGIMGLLLTLMLFSQHPTVRLNLQYILLNPLPWLFLWPVARRRQTAYWTITVMLAVLFLAGGLLQSYAEGIWSIGVAMLLQGCLHIYLKGKELNTKGKA